MLLIGAVSFLAVTVATYFAIAASGVGSPYVEVLSDKVEHLQTNHDDYDVMFLGTSSVYRNVNPRDIDRRLAELGVPVRSLNLAVPGMNVVEADNLFAQIERLRPERLRMIVLEPVFDYASILPGRRVIEAVRAEARTLGLDAEHGVSVRITGNVALNTEEMVTVARQSSFAAAGSFLLVGAVLLVALRSARLVASLLLTLLVGLVWTGAFAAFAVGHLNCAPTTGCCL